MSYSFDESMDYVRKKIGEATFIYKNKDSAESRAALTVERAVFVKSDEIRPGTTIEDALREREETAKNAALYFSLVEATSAEKQAALFMAGAVGQAADDVRRANQ